MAFATTSIGTPFPTFSERRPFDFVASDPEVLVQAADRIAGTLARRFDPDKQDENDNDDDLLGDRPAS